MGKTLSVDEATQAAVLAVGYRRGVPEANGYPYRLAKEIGVPAQRIGEILASRRAISRGSIMQ